jgi:cardiolipin synthase
MAKRATRYLYQWLLKYNIAIFEWNHSILHGKMAVVDGRWVTVGSYNLNHLSQYSSIEMNLEILDEAFAFDAKTRLQNLMLKASEVHAEQFVAAQGIVDRFLDWASYLLARWIMNLLFVLVLRDQKG